MKIVDFNIRVIDNIIELTPKEKIQDNCIYEIRFKDVESVGGQRLSESFKITTALSPLFCSFDSVKAILGDIEIDDNVILYNIREASKFAAYIKGRIDEEKVPFEASQFARFRAAHDCLINYSLGLTSRAGIRGTVGDVTFEESEKPKSVDKLLDHICKELKRWEDELKGYKSEGRAKMKGVIRGSKAQPLFSPYGARIDRGIIDANNR